MHLPLFNPSRVYHSTLRSKWEKLRFLSLMNSYQVDTVFTGHIHLYYHTTIDGVHYVITAGGGAPLYETPERGGSITGCWLR